MHHEFVYDLLSNTIYQISQLKAIPIVKKHRNNIQSSKIASKDQKAYLDSKHLIDAKRVMKLLLIRTMIYIYNR